MTESTDSQRPSGLPTHTPVRRPRAFSSRMRRRMRDAKPKLWSLITGNARVRYGKPWQMALFITMLILAIMATSFALLIDRS